MLIINRPQTNPWFNIAAEEYLLKNMKEDCFMLWQNEPSVIVGKHQNTMAEINHRYVKENNIPVIRRISGGGTVFHDLGNLNFSFIQGGEREKLVDFKKFVNPIINVLQSIGIPARFEGKNDIRVNGLKISGNAEHVFKSRVLHHGTLLFSSDLGNLNYAIKANEDNYKDKAVKSVRSSVANILDFLEPKVSIDEFKKRIIDYIFKHYEGVEFYNLTDNDIRKIEDLSKEKYKSWEWNYGYSPRFELKKKIRFNGQDFVINMEIKNGIIQKFSSEPQNSHLKEIVGILRGEKLEINSMKKVIDNSEFINPISRRKVQEIIENLVN